MFRKIVSRLSFSPALVGQLSFYAKRLKKEQFTRRLGLIFTALALVVQSLAVFQAPEPANAASSNDFIRGGVKSKSEFLNAYDKNSNNIKDIMSAFGITRAEINATKSGTFKPQNKYSWGRHARTQDKWSMEVENSKGKKVTTVYGRPMTAFYKANANIKGYIGYAKSVGWFAIMNDCANLVIEKMPPKPIKVCDTKTWNVVTINPWEFNSNRHKKSTANCKEPTERVCDIRTWKMITIKKSDFNKKIHSRVASKDCKEPTERVCDIRTWKMVTIKKSEYRKAKHSRVAEKDCKEPTERVCDIRTWKMITIKKSQYNKTIHSRIAEKDCKDTVIEVCVLKDKTLKRINKGDFDAKLHSQKLSDCDKNISVCLVDEMRVITIKESQFDEKIHSKETADCHPTPPPGDITLSKAAVNSTRGSVDATTLKASSNDRIIYTLSAKNTGGSPMTASFSDHLGDVLEYAKLIDNGGGVYNEEEKTISWPEATVDAGATESRTYTVQLLSTIPASPTGVSDRTSYDCRMDNVFGNGVLVPVDCPTPKVVEEVITELPKTGPTENMTFAAILLAVVTFFYYRSKQMNKEVRLVRRNLNTGTI